MGYFIAASSFRKVDLVDDETGLYGYAQYNDEDGGYDCYAQEGNGGEPTQIGGARTRTQAIRLTGKYLELRSRHEQELLMEWVEILDDEGLTFP